MKNIQQELRNNQNQNGGGLAVNITGKYESNRKALADIDTKKRTAGEVAKSLREDGHSFYAKEVKEVCEEWHHAGFYNVLGRRKTMGRTFYTCKSNEEVLQNLRELKVKKEDKTRVYEEAKKVKVVGYFYEWDYDYGGYRGKKRNYKVSRFFEGSKATANNIKNFTELPPDDKERISAAKEADGTAYYGWDEPNF